MTAPSDIANRALDAIGSRVTIGDLNEGTTEAKAAVRVYQNVRKQVLRAANWNFARRQATLTLLQDATGQTAGVGTGTVGMRPWLYEYQWPMDGLRARWVPATMYPITGGSTVPIMTGLAAVPFARQVPTRFLVAQDTVPSFTGVPASWQAFPDLQGVQGQGRSSQTVILSNQPQASLVYTGDVLEPDIWDPLFEQAVVSVLASYLAMPCLPDRKEALAVRSQMVQQAKTALDLARVSDGDEGWPTTDHIPDWIRVRSRGGYGQNTGNTIGDIGVLYNGWGACGFGDGSAY